MEYGENGVLLLKSYKESDGRVVRYYYRGDGSLFRKYEEFNGRVVDYYYREDGTLRFVNRGLDQIYYDRDENIIQTNYFRLEITQITQYLNGDTICYLEIEPGDSSRRGSFFKKWNGSLVDSLELEYYTGGSSLFKLIVAVDLDKNGEKVEYYDNGKIRFRANYYVGILNGAFTSYFDTGNIQVIGIYRMNVPYGYFKEYAYANVFGIQKYFLFQEGSYEMGVKQGTWYTYSAATGEVAATRRYNKG